VTVPCAWNAGLSLARASAEVSARGPSSAEKIFSEIDGLPAFFPGTAVVTETGINSSAKRPADCAAPAF
jgi:hypothetical protein